MRPHTALPEGIPPEGLRILKAESEKQLEEEFAKLAEDGYVPAGRLEVGTHYDEDERVWKVLYVLPLWKVGAEETETEGGDAYQ